MVDFNSRFYRVYAITVDKYGIDPLKDSVCMKLREIATFKLHDITVAERGAPDLVSFNEYGTELLWWCIMAYNGICQYTDFVEGTTLRIPDYGSVVEIINSSQASSGSAINTVTI